MQRQEHGIWRIAVSLEPGYHEYRFVVDGTWIADPTNPATTKNNYGEDNSVFVLGEDGSLEFRSSEEGDNVTTGERPQRDGTLYLALLWHQHQPYYLDAEADQLVGPWVRTHTTKDYYDMTAMVRDYPDIHVTVNLTPVLLTQIQTYYVERLGEFYNEETNRIDTDGFMAEWRGKTDPWIDLMFIPTDDFGVEEHEYLLTNLWNAFGMSQVQMDRFPEYAALRDLEPDEFTLQQKRNLKCWFFLAHFDPDFLRGPVELVTGLTVDLSDMISEEDGEIFRRGRDFSEDDANRLVAEAYKIAAAIVPLHASVAYNAETNEGQIEIITTPYFHPILPLINNIHAGQTSSDQAPEALTFGFPEDARRHVDLAVDEYRRLFGDSPRGMWPAEGSVSTEVLPLFADAGVEWVATGDGVLNRSLPIDLEPYSPYVVDGQEDIAVIFRDTHLSDLLGFRYQQYEPEEAAEDFIRQLLSQAPEEEGSTRFLAVILDGENAWEWYARDMDAKRTLNEIYRLLSELYEEGTIVTVTPSEYIHGNPSRDIPAHPLEELPRIEEMWPGSWIRGDYSTWIGEEEENHAWYWLETVREDLINTVGPWPEPTDQLRPRHLGALSAWRALLAAEGSDWFWWYGDDQNAPGGDQLWDELYRAHLRQVYRFMQSGGYDIEMPDIPCLLVDPDRQTDEDGQGATARGE